MSICKLSRRLLDLNAAHLTTRAFRQSGELWFELIFCYAYNQFLKTLVSKGISRKVIRGTAMPVRIRVRNING